MGETRKYEMCNLYSSISNQGKGILVLVISLSLMVSGGADSATAEHKFSEEKPGFIRARRDMIKTQIKTRGIKDERLLKAMLKVKRHLFVPDHIQKLAYSDHPLPIGGEQTISQPYIVALMTELLNLDGDDKVLEIGTGSGYQGMSTVPIYYIY